MLIRIKCFLKYVIAYFLLIHLYFCMHMRIFCLLFAWQSSASLGYRQTRGSGDVVSGKRAQLPLFCQGHVRWVFSHRIMLVLNDHWLNAVLCCTKYLKIKEKEMVPRRGLEPTLFGCSQSAVTFWINKKNKFANSEVSQKCTTLVYHLSALGVQVRQFAYCAVRLFAYCVSVESSGLTLFI